MNTTNKLTFRKHWRSNSWSWQTIYYLCLNNSKLDGWAIIKHGNSIYAQTVKNIFESSFECDLKTFEANQLFVAKHYIVKKFCDYNNDK